MKLPRVPTAPVPALLGGWDQDPLWSHVYPWLVDHRRVGGALWWLGTQSDLGLLHDAADRIADLPDGAVVLDVPSGGGVALRGLRKAQQVTYLAADISATMLARTMRAARSRGVEHLVTPLLADVGALPVEDASVDLVVSFTGLHCFPDPHLAVTELCRVVRPGGALVGSALLNDTGLRYEPMRRAGRLGGILGPGCTGEQVIAWLTQGGLVEVHLRVSGAFAYFEARRPR